MANEHTLQFNEDNFEAEVLQASLPVLVDFSGAHCPPCKALEPIIHDIAGEYAGKARVGTVSIEDNPSLAVEYRIGGVPTVLIFVNGQVVEQINGLVPKAKLMDALDSAF